MKKLATKVTVLYYLEMLETTRILTFWKRGEENENDHRTNGKNSRG